MRKYEPNDTDLKIVRTLAACGTPYEDIAKTIGMDRKTLYRYYKNETDTAKIKANGKVAESLFNLAIKGNVTACIFWLKTRAGWKEERDIEETAQQIVVNVLRHEQPKIEK